MRLQFSAAILSAALGSAAAQDTTAGRKIALGCQGCHGLDGLSKQPDAPNLAMQPEMYLVKAMKDYRSRARRHEQMNVAADALSEKEIADVAAYYAAIEIEVIKKPE
jgi:cytochrome c553